MKPKRATTRPERTIFERPPLSVFSLSIAWAIAQTHSARLTHWLQAIAQTVIFTLMSAEVTRILSAIEQGDPSAAEQLLPLVYDELRKLAALKLAQEKTGQTLQATALVHDAYLRLVDTDKIQHWNGRGHFFAAAAEAMRRILVETARKKSRLRHGGGRRRVDLQDAVSLADSSCDDLLALDEALTKLAASEPAKAELVKLRYFAGMSIDEAADLLHISRTTAKRYWAFARAWLLAEIDDGARES
jgi:RNA polymerase sigma factor (TIGR02999 family)